MRTKIFFPALAYALFVCTGVAVAQTAAPAPMIDVLPPLDRIQAPPSSPQQLPAWKPVPTTPDTSMYRKYIQISAQDITAPTVTEMMFPTSSPNMIARALVVDDSTPAAVGVPSLMLSYSATDRQILGASNFNASITGMEKLDFHIEKELQKMFDDNIDTYVEFMPRVKTPELKDPRSMINVVAEGRLDSSAFSLKLDKYVDMPSTVELWTKDNPEEEPHLVVAERRLTSGGLITFPRTKAKMWILLFSHSQPLRIAEINFTDNSAQNHLFQSVRFLAEPKHTYKVYYDPDRILEQYFGEIGNIGTGAAHKFGGSFTTISNPNYRAADQDGDNIPDISDNCPRDKNPDQTDVNANGIGDICDDFDRDGVYNSRDNCRDTPNVNQTDTDADGVGDACDDKENRFTEAHPWIPWAGMGVAALVLVVLFIMIARTANTRPPSAP
jgi:hypothetical protein